MVVKYVGGYCLPDDEPLGSGGVGEVWYAYNDEHSSCVLKMIHRSTMLKDRNWRERLRAEAMTAMRVQSPGVAHVYDIELDGPQPFIVSQYIGGQTLADHIKQSALLPSEVKQLAWSLYNTITDIHAAHVLHRDIKPSNIIMSESGPVLIDFGIARFQDAGSVTQTGIAVGTFAFLPPEVHRGESHNESSDWWAWAVTLLQASTGRPPFGVSGDALILERMFAGDPDIDGLPIPIGKAFQQALSPDAHDRLDPYILCQCLGEWLLSGHDDDTGQWGSAYSFDEREPVTDVIGSKDWTEVVGMAGGEHPMGRHEGPRGYDSFTEPTKDIVDPPIYAYPPGIPHSQGVNQHNEGPQYFEGCAGDGVPDFDVLGDEDPRSTPAVYAESKTSQNTIVGLLFMLVLGGVILWLGLTGVVVVASILFVLTFHGNVVNGLEKRRVQYGGSRSVGMGMALLKTPYYLLRSLVSLLISSCIGVVVASSMWSVIWLIEEVRLPTEITRPDYLWPLGAVSKIGNPAVDPHALTRDLKWQVILSVIVLISMVVMWALPTSGDLRVGWASSVHRYVKSMWGRVLLGCMLTVVVFALVWLSAVIS